MPFPQPEPGLVISYAYLWRHEYKAGKKEGRKAKPCVIVLAVERINGEHVVTVAPVTHLRPDNPSSSIEIPFKVKRHLDLDTERSWVILDEVNRFAWPGHDLQPVPGSNMRYDFGFLPPKLFDTIKTGILDAFIRQRIKTTTRD